MTNLVALFLDNLLPIFLAAFTGFLLAKWLNLDPRTLSQVVFFIFSPCLVFRLLTGSELDASDLVRMIGFAALVILIIGVITWVVGKFLRLERRTMMALLLTAMFMNAGNFGLSVNLFAFGNDGLAQASLYFVTSGILSYTIGVLIASMGTLSFREALIDLRKIPTVYAVFLGVLFMVFDWKLPGPVDKTVNLLASAAIPAMLVLLGMQFQRAEWRQNRLPLALSNILRLVIGPLLALSLSPLIGLHGVAFQAGVLESAMPTAVFTTILATQYDLEPSFVTTAVFTSTILSPLTLTPLLAFLVG